MKTPPSGFVKDLRAYDPRLRVRWGQASNMWVIEYHLRDPRHPELLKDKPPAASRVPMIADTWEGWKDGYIAVGFVPHDRLHWGLIGESIRAADLHAQGGRDALIRALDEQDDAYERSQERAEQTTIEAVVADTYDHMKWGGKERVSVPVDVVTDGV